MIRATLLGTTTGFSSTNLRFAAVLKLNAHACSSAYRCLLQNVKLQRQVTAVKPTLALHAQQRRRFSCPTCAALFGSCRFRSVSASTPFVGVTCAVEQRVAADDLERFRQLFRNVSTVWPLCRTTGEGDSTSDEAFALAGDAALGRPSVEVSAGVETTTEDEEAVAVALADETLTSAAAGALEGVEVFVTISGVSGAGVSSNTEGDLCAMERKRK